MYMGSDDGFYISYTLLKTISLFPSTVLASNQCIVIDSGVRYNKTFIWYSHLQQSHHVLLPLIHNLIIKFYTCFRPSSSDPPFPLSVLCSTRHQCLASEKPALGLALGPAESVQGCRNRRGQGGSRTFLGFKVQQ